MEDWRVGLSFSEWVISSREVWELVLGFWQGFPFFSVDLVRDPAEVVFGG